MKAFFDSLRRDFGPLNQSQVDGFNVLYAASKHLSIPHRAYILATAWHETATTMQPIHERGSGDGPDPDKWDDYLEKYDTGKLAVALGNTPQADGDGVRYAGRGYVQLTGRANYQKASLATGRDLVQFPEQAMIPEVAADIIVRGMTQGWFTGKKLSDYQTYKDMRRVVNGTDKAELIAGYAVKIERAIKANGEVVITPPPPVQPPPVKDPLPDAPKVDVTNPGHNIAAIVLGALGALIAAVATFIGFGGQ